MEKDRASEVRNRLQSLQEVEGEPGQIVTGDRCVHTTIVGHRDRKQFVGTLLGVLNCVESSCTASSSAASDASIRPVSAKAPAIPTRTFGRSSSETWAVALPASWIASAAACASSSRRLPDSSDRFQWAEARLRAARTRWRLSFSVESPRRAASRSPSPIVFWISFSAMRSSNGGRISSSSSATTLRASSRWPFVIL